MLIFQVIQREVSITELAYLLPFPQKLESPAQANGKQSTCHSIQRKISNWKSGKRFKIVENVSIEAVNQWWKAIEQGAMNYCG